MFKAGFVGIIGRANVGKSTLLNRILRQKVAIVTAKPHTTRTKITGIYNADDAQVVFLDTPGLHQGKTVLDREMNKEAFAVMRAADLLIWMVDATGYLKKSDFMLSASFKQTNAKVLLLFNKMDLVKDAKAFLKLKAKYLSLYAYIGSYAVSALTGYNIEILLAAVKRALPEGRRYYPEDLLTPNDERFLLGELIREKVILLTQAELPYAVAVDLINIKKAEDIVYINADIVCERESQKGIIIGKGGAMLKKIGLRARKDMMRLLNAKIYLELFVKVEPLWRDAPTKIKELVTGRGEWN